MRMVPLCFYFLPPLPHSHVFSIIPSVVDIIVGVFVRTYHGHHLGDCNISVSYGLWWCHCQYEINDSCVMDIYILVWDINFSALIKFQKFVD